MHVPIQGVNKLLEVELKWLLNVRVSVFGQSLLSDVRMFVGRLLYLLLLHYVNVLSEHLLSVTRSRMLALIEIELSMMLLVSDQSISLLSFGKAERTST